MSDIGYADDIFTLQVGGVKEVWFRFKDGSGLVYRYGAEDTTMDSLLGFEVARPGKRD